MTYKILIHHRPMDKSQSLLGRRIMLEKRSDVFIFLLTRLKVEKSIMDG